MRRASRCAGHLRLYNSAANLRDRSLPEAIGSLLGLYDAPADCLRAEVTEGTLMADTACAQDVLWRIGALGVGVSVDDFGAGYYPDQGGQNQRWPGCVRRPSLSATQRSG